MNLDVTREIEVDFYDSKYICINAKQYDNVTRFLLITCCNQGEPIAVDSNCNAYIRYRKADDLIVLNNCIITDDGKVLVELTEQMLAAEGICQCDIVIYRIDNVITKVVTEIDTSTGSEEVGTGSNGSTSGLYSSDDNMTILATMTIYINVKPSAIDSLEVESSNEFNTLTAALSEVKNNYVSIIDTCEIYADEAAISANQVKSWAIGGTGTRDGEDTDNAKYYYNKSLENASNASNSENAASSSATLAKSWAIGGTGTRDGEDTDNSKYYCDESKKILVQIGSTFKPKGTVTLSELAAVAKEVGDMYCIADDNNEDDNIYFTTDNTFKNPGKTYPFGTFVYYTTDGYWDCFEVSIDAVDAITVTDFKSYLSI